MIFSSHMREKPFITEMTTVMTATPSATPRMQITEMIEKSDALLAERVKLENDLRVLERRRAGMGDRSTLASVQLDEAIREGRGRLSQIKTDRAELNKRLGPGFGGSGSELVKNMADDIRQQQRDGKEIIDAIWNLNETMGNQPTKDEMAELLGPG